MKHLNKIHIVTIDSRKEIFEQTKSWWESHGWEVISLNNTDTLLAEGRNKFLKEFYKSDDDWIIISDDDLILWEDGMKIVGFPDWDRTNSINTTETFLTDNSTFFNNIPDQTVLVTPARGISFSPATRFDIWSYRYLYNNDYCKDSWMLVHTKEIAGIMMMKNTKKHLDKEFYQDAVIPSLEDLEFAIQILDAGYNTAAVINIAYNSLTPASDSTLFSSQEERVVKNKLSCRYLADKYYGIECNDEGRINKRKWMQRIIGPVGFRTVVTDIKPVKCLQINDTTLKSEITLESLFGE